MEAHDECQLRRDRGRSPLRRVAHGGAAGPQRLPGAADRQSELSKRHHLTVIGTVSASEFFAPENVSRIIVGEPAPADDAEAAAFG